MSCNCFIFKKHPQLILIYLIKCFFVVYKAKKVVKLDSLHFNIFFYSINMQSVHDLHFLNS